MYSHSNTFMPSELAYRADRARAGLSGRRRRAHPRSPLVRRPAVTDDRDH